MTPLEQRAIKEAGDHLEQIENDLQSLAAGYDEIPTGGGRLERVMRDVHNVRAIIVAIRDSQ